MPKLPGVNHLRAVKVLNGPRPVSGRSDGNHVYPAGLHTPIFTVFLRLCALASLRYQASEFNAKAQRRKGAEHVEPGCLATNRIGMITTMRERRGFQDAILLAF